MLGILTILHVTNHGETKLSLKKINCIKFSQDYLAYRSDAVASFSRFSTTDILS